MSHTEVLVEKFVIGIALRTTNENGRAEIEIPNHWKRFMTENILEKIPNKTSRDVIALYTDYEKERGKPRFMQPYTLIIGSEVSSLDEIPKGLAGKKIPSSTYAVFDCKGKFPDSLIKKWMDIWAMPLKRTYTGDFELYPENFDPTKHHDVQIYIAVEK